MTIGDHPKYLALGYLINQNIIEDIKKVTSIEVEEDISTVVVRTLEKTKYEIKENKKIKTSGCANGSIFEDVIEQFDKQKIESSITVSSEEIFKLYKQINSFPSLYLKSGAIHGCLLCSFEEPLVFFEDVGRHNAIDKLAGYMALNKIKPKDKILYTTGRLTSEMVIKTVLMRIPILASRSGFTAWGVELARKSNLTMIGRLRGKRYQLLSGEKRIEKIVK
tara:strand:+ start:281 stop:943 length:663 start_codon:yes stop_codon:yes gene_type:complete